MSDRNTGRATAATREELISRARALIPVLAERSEEAERIRHIPDETVEDLHRTGLWRILQPKSRGGSELDYSALVDIPTILARGCASTAWVHVNLASHHWMLGMWPPEAQDVVWGDNPDTLIGSALIYPPGKVQRVDGGFRLSGRWSFSSGIHPCDWIMLGGMVPPESGDGPPVPYIFVVNVKDIEVIDTWHVAGLAGTGSQDVACDDVFVPWYMALSCLDIRGGPTPGSAVNPGELYRLSVLGLFPHILAGPMTGMAEGAFDDYVGGLRDAISTYNSSRVAEHTTIQMKIAEAGALIQASKLLLRENCAEGHRMAAAGEVPSLEDKTRWRRDAAHAAGNAVKAMDLIYGMAGASANYLTSPLQRRFRDIHAAAHQIQVIWDINAPEYGRAVLGLPLENKNL